MNKKSGFTMIEFLLYMGLLGILLVVMTDLFVSILALKQDTESLSAVEQDGKYIYLRMSYDVSRADSLVVNNLNPDEMVLTISGADYTYALNNGDLIYSGNNLSEKLNSSDTKILTLDFIGIGNPNNKTVKINYSVESIVEMAKGKKQINYSTTLRIK